MSLMPPKIDICKYPFLPEILDIGWKRRNLETVIKLAHEPACDYGFIAEDDRTPTRGPYRYEMRALLTEGRQPGNATLLDTKILAAIYESGLREKLQEVANTSMPLRLVHLVKMTVGDHIECRIFNPKEGVVHFADIELIAAGRGGYLYTQRSMNQTLENRAMCAPQIMNVFHARQPYGVRRVYDGQRLSLVLGI